MFGKTEDRYTVRATDRNGHLLELVNKTVHKLASSNEENWSI